jgi:type VI secretion system protein ImpF
MNDRTNGYFQVSLMNVFRQAARERDAKSVAGEVADTDGRTLSRRSVERREGADQATLRDHLAIDLGNLMATINFEATVPLDGLDHVRRSILNYGIQDMSRLTDETVKDSRVMRDLRATLLAHEPRLIAETLVVKLRRPEADSKQRMAFDITAEMSARPVDVPLEFVAEIDTGAGKIAVSNLVVRG